MDTPKLVEESGDVPFWYDDYFKIMDLSTGQIFEDVFRHGFLQTDLTKARAWWNTNLVMEGYMPVVIPAFDASDSTENYKIFNRRFIQRNTTDRVPLMPQVMLSHGLIKVNPIGEEVLGFYYTDPHDPVLMWFYEFEYSTKTMVKEQGGRAVENGDMIERESNVRYWNGTQYV